MATSILKLNCKDCGTPFDDWTTLFDHVIQCDGQQSKPTAPAAKVIAVTDESATPNAGSNAKNAVSKSGPGPTEQPSPRSGRYRCICGLSYTVIYNLHRHQRDKGCLLAGMSSNSPVEVTAASASGPFFCPYPNCGKKIQFERNYRSHITFHETEERKWAQIRAEQTTPQVQTGSDEITSVSKSSASMTVDAAAIDVQMEIEL